jgi:hypothetical protein
MAGLARPLSAADCGVVVLHESLFAAGDPIDELGESMLEVHDSGFLGVMSVLLFCCDGGPCSA